MNSHTAYGTGVHVEGFARYTWARGIGILSIVVVASLVGVEGRGPE